MRVRMIVLAAAWVAAAGPVRADGTVLSEAAVRERIGALTAGPLMEGFAKAVEAGYGRDTYASPRGTHVPCWQAHAESDPPRVVWETPPVPAALADNAVTFVLTGGVGSGRSENARFELTAGGKPVATFTTAKGKNMLWSGPGGRVLLQLLRMDKYRDSYGLFFVTVEPELLTAGRPVRFQARALTKGSNAWFMVLGDRDNVDYLRGLAMLRGHMAVLRPARCRKNPPVWTAGELMLLSAGGGKARGLASIAGASPAGAGFGCAAGGAMAARLGSDGAVLYSTETEEGPQIGLVRPGEEPRLWWAGRHPAWLPDGKGFVFCRAGRLWRLLLNVDGKAAQALPLGQGLACRWPDVAPDGERVVFVAGGKTPEQSEIRVGRLGAAESRVVATGWTASPPRWSPDGSRIACEIDGQIYLMDPDGTNRGRLTGGGGVCCNPVWSGDGQAVAYCRGPSFDGPWEIEMASADGRKVLPVAKGQAQLLLDWRAPDAKPQAPPELAGAAQRAGENLASGLPYPSKVAWLVCPDRFANDLVLPAAAEGGAREARAAAWVSGALPPGAPALLLAADGRQMAVLTPAPGGSALGVSGPPGGRGELKGVANAQGGKPQPRAATLEGKDLWAVRELPAPQKPSQAVTVPWKAPVAGVYRLSVIAKDGTVRSRLFSTADAIYDWWDKMEVAYQRTYAGGEQPVYDGKTIRIDDAPAGGGTVLVYLYDRVAETPRDVLTPMDVLRRQLGVADCRKRLDLEGLRTCVAADRPTVWPTLRYALKDAAGIAERVGPMEAPYVAMLCADIRAGLEQARRRLEAYAGSPAALKKPLVDLRHKVPAGLPRALQRLDAAAAQARTAAKQLDAALACCDALAAATKIDDGGKRRNEVRAAAAGVQKVADASAAALQSCRREVQAVRDAAARARAAGQIDADTCRVLREAARRVLRTRHPLENDRRGERLRYVRGRAE